ncbi:MAG: chitobiase/beta-hexosaminidase C-terminal domain-containing protein, partial [Bacteroidota bacterium]
LKRLRAALETWREEYGDWGTTPETEQADRMWPAGEQPVTAAPEAKTKKGTLRLSSPTAGASVAYRLNGTARWQPYVSPIPLEDIRSLRAKAVRYGYAPSIEVDLGNLKTK